MKTLLAILAFIPLSLLRWVGMFLTQKDESLGESFKYTWEALFGDGHEGDGPEVP